MRQSHLGKKASTGTKKKLSDIRKGKPLSPQAREASRRSRSGVRPPDHVIQSIIDANTGKKHTDISKANMSKSQSKRWNKLSYNEAIAFVHPLGFTSCKQYWGYVKSNSCCQLPYSPDVAYKSDWVCWPAFLGYSNYTK